MTEPHEPLRRRAAVRSAVWQIVDFDLGEQVDLVRYLVRWWALGTLVGIAAGLSSAFFLWTLDKVTEFRLENGWLIGLLPVAGLAIGFVNHRWGGTASGGNNLIIDEIHEPRAWIPKRMAALVYIGTEVTHLFGGSAGREGTALQMSGSLTDIISRVLRLDEPDRRIMLIASLAGGFGAVFGVPIAGCVFGLEVQSVGRLRYDALVPALTAALVGDKVVRGLGVKHTVTPQMAGYDITAPLLAKVALAGLCFGLTALVFAELTHGIKRIYAAGAVWPPLRPFIGGLAIVGLTVAVGSQTYNGLSLELAARSLAGGAGIIGAAFALKLLFTAVTLGSGFQGGEVTPLFVIGATLGVTLGRLLGVPTELLAAVGFVSVFAGAANVPLACTVMGAELFGADGFVLFAVGCVTSSVFSSHRGIYTTQRVAVPKGPTAHLPSAEGGSVGDIARRKRP